MLLCFSLQAKNSKKNGKLSDAVKDQFLLALDEELNGDAKVAAGTCTAIQKFRMKS